MTDKFFNAYYALSQVNVFITHLVKESELKREGFVRVAKLLAPHNEFVEIRVSGTPTNLAIVHFVV